MSSSRRDFLAAGAASLPLLGLPNAALASARSAAFPAPVPSNKKLLFVFLRGGCDGLDMLRPADSLDDSYGDVRDPNDIVHPEDTPLPNTHSRLHDHLSGLLPAWSQGRVAFLNRVGSSECLRSHFKEMRVVETGKPGSIAELISEWWGARLTSRFGMADLRATSLTGKLQQFLQLSQADRVFPSLSGVYKYETSIARYDKVFDVEPAAASHPLTALTDKWAARYGASLATSATEESQLLQASGDAFYRVKNALPPFYVHDETTFPFGSSQGFMEDIELAMNVLADGRLGCQVAGVDLGGFDTHSEHRPSYDALLETLSRGLVAADDFAQKNDKENDYMILVVTEFGRTLCPNASKGLDHGIGACYIAIGSGVRGGVYNCKHPSSPSALEFGQEWPRNHVSDQAALINAMDAATDFRAVFAELLIKHFALGLTDVGQVLPGYETEYATSPYHNPLDYML